jgi:UDP-glucose 4-epimerase
MASSRLPSEVEESIKEPEQYYDNNFAKSVRFIRALRDANITTLVFSSSCAVYGIPDQLPIQEEMPQRPVSPYGESKLAVERMLQAYERAYGFRSVSLRYFNAAGADLDGEIGEARKDQDSSLVHYRRQQKRPNW